MKCKFIYLRAIVFVYQQPNSDIAIAADDGTNSFVEDRYNSNNIYINFGLGVIFIRFVSTTKVQPSNDMIQSFTETVTNRMSGVLSFAFTRLINSTDISGEDVNLNICQYVIWAFGGTVTFGAPVALGYHGMSRRGIFSNQICLQQCDRASGKWINS